MSPESIDSLVSQADALRAIGRYDDAIVLMQRALTIDPENYGSFVTLGLAQLGAATPKAALDTASRAAALRPEAAVPHRIRASAYRSLGRKREALDEANRVVTLEPDFATSHQLLAEMLAISRKRNEAVKAAAHAISLDPESAAAYETLGFALMHAKRRGPEAEAALRTALALDPARSTARFNLGLVLRQQGRAQEALGCRTRRSGPTLWLVSLRRAFPRRQRRTFSGHGRGRAAVWRAWTHSWTSVSTRSG